MKKKLKMYYKKIDKYLYNKKMNKKYFNKKFSFFKWKIRIHHKINTFWVYLMTLLNTIHSQSIRSEVLRLNPNKSIYSNSSFKLNISFNGIKNFIGMIFCDQISTQRNSTKMAQTVFQLPKKRLSWSPFFFRIRINTRNFWSFYFKKKYLKKKIKMKFCF
jgi:hypothetical protein